MNFETKNILADTFCKLMETKSFKKITVEDITNSYGACRQTFYNHFKDKYDLINWIYLNDHRQALASLETGNTWRESLYLSYLVFWKHKQFYKSVSMEDGQNNFIDFLWGFCNLFYEQSIVKRYGSEEITDELRFSIHFNNYGAVNMFKMWLEDGLKNTPEEMANLLVDNMPMNLKKYFD